jgi:uncharacterized protein
MALLVISVLALALGPILYRMADAARRTLLALDGFVLIAVSGLVVIHIIPHAFAVAGLAAPVLAILGFFGPALIERNLHKAARQTHIATLVVACLGLIAHEFVDGVALAMPSTDPHNEGSILAIAVVLHRLPVAITVWWLLRPSMGLLIAVGTLVAMGVATVCGFAFSEMVGASVHTRWVGLVQALVAGSLLHVVLHRPPPLSLPSGHGRGHVFAGLGALAGLVLVGALSDTHMPLYAEPGAANFGETFLALALESAPALLIAFALAGLVQVFLPHAPMRWMRTGNATTEAMRGVAFGLPLPICSCGVIPLYQTLIKNGVPATAAMAFLVATPELGLDAILISLPLLGGELAVARIVAAGLVALVVGAIIGRMADARRKATPELSGAPAFVQGNLLSRVRLGLRYGFGEIVDHIGPWLLLGLVVASLVEPMISGRWLALLPWGVEVVIFALLGMPMYVCASGATPLVAVLIHKGVSPGAALAFLLAGPATNITTFGVLARLHGRKIAFAFAAAIAGLAIGLGIALNLFMGEIDGLSLHESASEEPELLPMLSLAVLAVVFALSIVRQGPRHFVGQVLSPYDHDEDCQDEHCHDEHRHDEHRHDGHCHDEHCQS